MDLQTVHHNETGRIEINPTRSFISLTWFTHPSSAKFREIIGKAHECAQQHGLTKWLCDLQQAEFLEVEDQFWLVEEVFTQFDPTRQHDYAYLIQPMVLEVLTAYHIHDLIQVDDRLRNIIQVAIFNDIDLAQQWLFTPFTLTK